MSGSGKRTLTKQEQEYLHHMIPHHQLAVDMSEELLKTTNDSNLIHMCRTIIWQQKYEIWLMTDMLQNGTGWSSSLLSDK
jgi:uncharacterized protein (DUF305 family)